MTPAELMFGQTIKTKFDLLYPDLTTKVNSAQEKQKEYFDKRTKNRVFNDNDLVYVRNYSRTSNVRWIPGQIKKRIGNVLYEVILQNNNLTRRHVNQLKIRMEERIPELEASSYTTVRNRVLKQIQPHLQAHHATQSEVVEHQFDLLMKIGTKRERV